jgi:Protein of unknown function (DUF4236)
MSFGFRKSVPIMPGVRVNFGKRGTSVSVGGRGATMHVSKMGVRTTASLPGTGLSYSKFHPRRRGASSRSPLQESAPTPVEQTTASVIFLGIVTLLVVAGVLLMLMQ